jgi:hypothetical protein
MDSFKVMRWYKLVYFAVACLLVSFYLGGAWAQTKPSLPFDAKNSSGLVPQCVDCPRNISGMTGHSLRLDGNNYPHIAYGSDHLYHAWNDGVSWKTEVVDPAPGVGYAASLAFDNTGKVGISYYDDYNHSLKLARWSGTAWTLQTVDSSPYAGYTSSLAFNGAGQPRIAYVDYDSDHGIYHVKYAEWTGTAWNIFPVIDNASEASLSLALDQSGQPHISFWRNDYPRPGGLIYASWVSNAWVLQIVESNTDAGRNNALAFDSQNKPHIIYFDSGNGVVNYASWTGTAWTIENAMGSGSLGMDRLNPASLVFGTGDMPMVALSLGESDPKSTLVWLLYKSDGVWHHDQNYDIAGNSGARWPSIAADSSGKPHISYLDYNTGQLHYTRLTAWGPNTWSDAVIDSGAQVGQGASLAMDRFGRPHIAYMDLTHGIMKYATQVLELWQTSAVNVASMKPAHGHALAVDSTGKPHIAYSDTSAKKIMYATLNGSNWTAEVAADDTGTDIEKYISLAFDAADNPHLSFHDSSYTAINLKYAHKSSGAWVVSVVDALPVGITGLYNSIAIDSSGKPHVSYYNYYSSSLWYASWNGTSWDKAPVDSGNSAGFYTSLALDSLNHPHICYSDEINYFVKYATFDGNQWSLKTLTAPDPGRADRRDSICSIKIDSGNVPYVSYFSKINRHLAIAHPVSGNWVSAMVDVNGDNGEQNSLGMYNGVPYIAYYHYSNKDLMFIAAIVADNFSLYLPMILR